jgi:hypothetical protein
MGVDTAPGIPCWAISSMSNKRATQKESKSMAHGLGSHSADSMQRRDFPARPVGEGLQTEQS